MYPPGSGVPLSVTLFWSWLCECPKRQAARCKPWFVPSCTHIMLTQYSCDEKAVDETKILRVTRSPGRGHAGHTPPNNRFQMDGVSTNWGLTTFAHLQNLKDGLVLEGERPSGVQRPQKPLLKLRKTRISRSKQLRRAVRLWFVCVF